VKINILLPVEIASRELFAKVLLAHKFSTKNCNSYIGDKNSILKFSKHVPGAVYFDKGYHRGVSEFIYEKLDENDITIVSLDEENAVDYHDFQQINLRFPDNILNKFSIIFLWGVKQFQYLENNRMNFDKDKIFVTGHPRFELLKNEYRIIYKDKVDDYIQKYDKFILINTNFGLGNNIRGDKFVIGNYGSRFPQIESLITYQKKQVNNFINLCKDLSKKLDHQIILRPHPEENIERYKKCLNNYDNVQVISEGSVIPWIIASDVMIHHDCTTGLECAMLGKNSIAYTKDLNIDLTTDIPLRISYQYDSTEEVLWHIKSSSTIALKIDHEILDTYFSFNSKSVDHIVNATLKLVGLDSSTSKRFIFYKIISNMKNKLKKVLAKSDRLYEKKIEGLDLNNIEKIVYKYNCIYGKSVYVEKIHDKLYKLTDLS
jgi:surface carbohydrate biosynthesis protein